MEDEFNQIIPLDKKRDIESGNTVIKVFLPYLVSSL